MSATRDVGNRRSKFERCRPTVFRVRVNGGHRTDGRTDARNAASYRAGPHKSRAQYVLLC